MSDKKYPIGGICGRFQVDELHEAHKHLIDQVVDKHKKVILFLGVANVLGSKKNSLNFEIRKKMIQSQYPDVIIISLPDMEDDKEWSIELDKRLREVYPNGDVLLYGGRDSFLKTYCGQFDTTELQQDTFVSGTAIRENISEANINSPQFRAGIINHAYNQPDRVIPSIDTIITDNDVTKILLAKKPGELGWRIPGGLVRTYDNSYEDSAKRIVKQKTNLDVDRISYITTMKVDDWRYRSEDDKIITTLYHVRPKYGLITPSNDLSELKWFDLKELMNQWFDMESWVSFAKLEYSNPKNGIVKEHLPLLTQFIKNVYLTS